MEALHDDAGTPAQADAAVRATESLVLPPQYLIRLVASPEDLASRRCNRRFDPVTGVELLLEDVEVPAPPVGDDGNEEEDANAADAGGDGDDDEEDDAVKVPVEDPPKPFVAAPIPPVSRAAYDAGVIRPDDVEVSGIASGSGSKTTANAESPCAAASARFISRFVGPFLIDLDDTRPVQELVTGLELALSLRDAPSVREPIILEGVDAIGDEAVDALLASSLPDGDGDDEPSPWLPARCGGFCPVTLRDSGRTVRGSGECGVVYNGRVYVMADSSARQKFVTCPRQYAGFQPTVACRVLLVGVGFVESSTTSDNKGPTVVRLPDGAAKASPDEGAMQAVVDAVVAAGDTWVIPEVPPAAVPLLVAALDASLCFVLAAEDSYEVVRSAVRDTAVACGQLTTTVQPSADNTEDDSDSGGGGGGSGADSESSASRPPAVTAVELREHLRAPVLPRAVEEPHEVEFEDPHPSPYDASLPDAGYGATRHFCPVTLKEAHVLRPGDPQLASRYQGEWYEMATAEARAAFVADPDAYAPRDRPVSLPPPRVCFIGPPAAGKTLHGRRIARRHRLPHVSFPERLAEIAATPGAQHAEACAALLGEDKTELDPAVVLDIVRPLWHDEPYVRCTPIVLLDKSLS